MDTYCDAWHSSSTDKVGLASSLLAEQLLAQERYACNSRFAVLCIEATSQATSGRRRREVEENILDEEAYQQLLVDLYN